MTPAHVFVVAMGDDFLEDPQLLLELHQAATTDPLPKLGLARVAMSQDHFNEARRLLEEVVRDYPDMAEAQIRLGRILLLTDNATSVGKWYSELPPLDEDHPQLWTLRGLWSRRLGDPRSAIRCFAEAVRRDPNSAESNYQLGQLLSSTNLEELAKPFLVRAERLRAYSNKCYSVVTHRGPVTPTWFADVKQASEAAEALGLNWEAYGWACVAASAKGVLDDEELKSWAPERKARLEPKLPTSPSSRTLVTANPTRNFPWGQFPPFDPPTQWPASADPATPSSQQIRLMFRDDAVEAGLSFTFYNDGAPLSKPTFRMYEFTGGGVGIGDFDRDGWPDVYLTQGCEWAHQNSGEFFDAIYRNQVGTTFAEITEGSRIREDGYSQGVAVGDFNNDGFPDLFIANIGPNRMFQNLGDGTFVEVAMVASQEPETWSTSCLMADLNGDALPDIYIANYLSGPDVFSRTCVAADGSPQTCLPQNFHGTPDQVLLNQGDGSFADISREAGFAKPGGKGLGVIAADFHGNGQPSVFVANDQAANFWFVAGDPTSDGRMVFADQGLPSGVALNARGQLEACMGVAVGDADGDGRLDLFVTNFAHESNTLYLQQPEVGFIDSTDKFGLRRPSLPLLGFGTQFFDPDHDGDMDLVVANGHIHQTGQDRERMPTQLFKNEGGRRFALQTAADGGPYFTDRYLGRGLALLDWNRDGRQDSVVSHLDAPVALLTNNTSTAAHWVRLRLVGTKGSRDAVGASVTLSTRKRKLIQQVVAGAGYLSSNERCLTFGLGENSHVEGIEIRWPSGTVEQIDQVAIDAETIIVEGESSWTLHHNVTPQ